MNLYNQLSKNVSTDERVIVLYDRLLWLRNHYDVGQLELKEQVLADVDAVLRKLDGVHRTDQQVTPPTSEVQTDV